MPHRLLASRMARRFAPVSPRFPSFQSRIQGETIDFHAFPFIFEAPKRVLRLRSRCGAKDFHRTRCFWAQIARSERLREARMETWSQVHRALTSEIYTTPILDEYDESYKAFLLQK